MIGANTKILIMIEETLNELIQNKKLSEDKPVVLLKENYQFGKWSEAEFILISLSGYEICKFKTTVNPNGNINLRTLYECIILAYVKGLANS